MFSKACEYGIRAMVLIALRSEEGARTGLKEIADSIDSPEAFTSKILQQLTRDHLINSAKGPNGGYEMTPEQLDKVYLKDVVRCIDGDLIYTGCGLGLSQCSEEDPCPLHFEFRQIRDQLSHMLEKTSIRQLSENYQEGADVLKN